MSSQAVTFIPYDRGMEIARDFYKKLEKQGIFSCLCGGFAMALYGSDRMTKDMDFLASALPNKIKPDRRLSFGGVSCTYKGIQVDTIVRTDEQKELYEQALEYRIFPKGLGIAVIEPRWLALMKRMAGRSKDEADIKFLIKAKVIKQNEMLRFLDEVLGKGSIPTKEDFKQLFLECEIEMEIDKHRTKE